ncbi:MAG: ABC transporter permease, partial [Oscillospiraceae bacterium]
MNRILAFSSRNIKELLRDPLSYIFCLGFPLVMLVIMSIVNQSIPAEANMTIFNIENLSAGIAMFGLSFVMLFTCLTVSKDRSGAFLTRLYASPMRSADFIAGYMLPVLVLALIQLVISFAASLLAAVILGENTMNIGGVLLA